jgi:predicted DNA-binding transcriptional regulator AlpA
MKELSINQTVATIDVPNQADAMIHAAVKKLYKTEDVLKYAGISRGMLYKLMSQGLPHIKVGKSLRFNIESVQGWFQSKEVSE